MKKFFLGVLMFIIFIVLYLIQSNFFDWFTIAGISPNIFIIFMLFLGLFTNNRFSLAIAVLSGITLDLLVGRTLGVNTIVFCLIVVAGGYFDKNFSKENKISIIIMVIGLTIGSEIISYLLNSLLLEIPLELLPFAKILIIEVIYNVILTFIFYGLILKLGGIIERQFKQRNILTRYF